MSARLDNVTFPPWIKSYPSFVDWETEIPAEPVHAAFLYSVEAYRNRPCMEFLGNHWTYAETASLVFKAAKGFQELGLGKGDKIALILPNTPYYIVCYYAALMIGSTVVNINPLYVQREIKDLIIDSEAKALVTMDLELTYAKTRPLLDETDLKILIVCPMGQVLPLATSILFRIFRRRTIADITDDPRQVWFKELTDNAGDYLYVKIEPETDVAVFQYTGGTTGALKAAMLTHSNIAANTFQIFSWDRDPDLGREKILAALPFFHVFSMTAVMNLAIKCGGEIILLPRFELKDCLNTIHKKKPTYFPAVPTIFSAINNCPDIDKYDLSSIKLCISGGAPLPVEVKTDFERITNCVVIEGYGLSETSPVVTTNPTEGDNKAGSVGIPMPATWIEIRDAEDPDRILPIGEKGEVYVRGPQVMKGYWKKPEQTTELLRDGLFRTGDLGYIDEDGYLFLIDRLKDIIIAGGYNIYPRIVEEAIQEHPAVEEVTVIGIDDPYLGQVPKAYIKTVANETLTLEAIEKFLGDKLSPIERPRSFEFRNELPKTLIGKLSKKHLREEESARASNKKDNRNAE